MTFRTLKKWLSSAVTTILCIILIFMAFVVISSKVSGSEPSILGYQFKSVLSGSMEPTFQTGSVIAVKPVKETSQLQKGDVITYKVDKATTVTHRIYEVKGTDNQPKYITKGDNNENQDLKPVLPENVKAVYTGFSVPFLGYFIHYAQSKEGSALLIVLPGILLIIYSVIMIWKAFKEIDEPKKKEGASTTSV
ncbi:signal peptidase I [Halobacillus shinanisalinarum]|uniref:Signal peptidase I n=1 Tax=Halobacillus shinanisalinarum TaxID=2932258 RepID=A0ABY4GVJ9_9BACI|nr:signal peptidase I [Halobacillus shinanisalinarum]UOQ92173.1 signal peptidase I [Halobacillus shinanisalinarum]